MAARGGRSLSLSKHKLDGSDMFTIGEESVWRVNQSEGLRGH